MWRRKVNFAEKSFSTYRHHDGSRILLYCRHGPASNNIKIRREKKNDLNFVFFFCFETNERVAVLPNTTILNLIECHQCTHIIRVYVMYAYKRGRQNYSYI